MEPYEYHVTGRDPFFVVVTLVGLVLVGGAIMMDAPWWIILIWGLGAILLVWRYYLNPKSGFSLDGEALHFYGEGRAGSIAIKDIAKVEITLESEGPDLVFVHLVDGGQVTLPKESYPGSRKLRAQLERFGIAHNPA